MTEEEEYQEYLEYQEYQSYLGSQQGAAEEPTSIQDLYDQNLGTPEDLPLGERVASRFAMTIPVAKQVLGSAYDVFNYAGDEDQGFNTDPFREVARVAAPGIGERVVDAYRAGIDYFDANEAGKNLADRGRAEVAQIARDVPNTGPYANYVEAIPSVAGIMGVGALSGPAAAFTVPAYAAGLTFNELYPELQQSRPAVGSSPAYTGKSRGDAARAAVPATALTTAVSLPMGAVFSGGTGLKATLEAAAFDALTEPLETVAELATREIAGGQDFTPEEYRQYMWETFKVALPISFGMAGAGKLSSRITQGKTKPEVELTDAEIAQLDADAEMQSLVEPEPEVAPELEGDLTPFQRSRIEAGLDPGPNAPKPKPTYKTTHPIAVEFAENTTTKPVSDPELVKLAELSREKQIAEIDAELLPRHLKPKDKKSNVPGEVLDLPKGKDSSLINIKEGVTAPQPIWKIAESGAYQARTSLREGQLAGELELAKRRRALTETPVIGDSGPPNRPRLPADRSAPIQQRAQPEPAAQQEVSDGLTPFQRGRVNAGRDSGQIGVGLDPKPSRAGIESEFADPLLDRIERTGELPRSIEIAPAPLRARPRGEVDSRVEPEVATTPRTAEEAALLADETIENAPERGRTEIARPREEQAYESPPLDALDKLISEGRKRGEIKVKDTAEMVSKAQAALALELAEKEQARLAEEKARVPREIAEGRQRIDKQIKEGQERIKKKLAKGAPKDDYAKLIKETAETAKSWEQYYQTELEVLAAKPESKERNAAIGRAAQNLRRWQEYDGDVDLSTMAMEGQTAPRFDARVEEAYNEAFDEVEARIGAFRQFDNETGALTIDPFNKFADWLGVSVGQETVTDLTPNQKYFQGYKDGLKIKVGDFEHQIIPRKVLALYRRNIVHTNSLSHKFPKKVTPVYDAGWSLNTFPMVFQNRLAKSAAPYFFLSDAQLAPVDAVLLGALKNWKDGDITASRLAKLDMTKFGFKQKRLTGDQIKATIAFNQATKDAWTLVHDSLIKKAENDYELKKYQEGKKFGDDKAGWEAWNKNYYNNTYLPKLRNIENRMVEMRKANYVPQTRFGEFTVRHLDKVTGEPVDKRFETKSAQNRYVRQMKKEGFKALDPRVKENLYKELGSDELIAGQFAVAEGGALGANLPDDIKLGLGELDPEAFAELAKQNQMSGSFTRHFIQAKNIKGAETDLMRPMADYLSSISHFAARLQYEGELDLAIEKLDPEHDKSLRIWAERYKQEQFGHHPDAGLIRQVFAFFHLAFNPKATTLNAIQPAMSLLPELSRYTKSVGEAEVIFVKAEKLALEYRLAAVAANPPGSMSRSATARKAAEAVKNPRPLKAFEKKHPELFKILQQSDEYGVTTDLQLQKMMGRENTPSKIRKTFNAMTDVGMIGQSLTETNNRTWAQVAGYLVAPKEWDFDKKFYFGRHFNVDVNYDYSVANVNQFFRGSGVARTLGVFRIFQGSMLHQMRFMLDQGEYKAFSKMIAMTFLSGGAKALPFVSIGITAALMAGYDVEGELRKLVKDKDWERFLFHGLPGRIAGVNLSGSIDLTQGGDLDKGALMAISSLVLGANKGIFDRAERVYKILDEHPGKQSEKIMRILETMSPDGFRGSFIAERTLKPENEVEGEPGMYWLRSPITDKPIAKLSEAAVRKRQLGFQTVEQSESYSERSSNYLLREKMEGNRSQVNSAKIAKAIREGDDEYLDELINRFVEIKTRAIEEGRPEMDLDLPQGSDILMQYLANTNPEIAEFLRFPVKGRPALLKQKEEFRNK